MTQRDGDAISAIALIHTLYGGRWLIHGYEMRPGPGGIHRRPRGQRRRLRRLLEREQARAARKER
jgi:hypothetical protein